MKHILSVLFIVVTTFICNANNPITTPFNTPKEVNENEIPKEVKKWLKAKLANSTTTVLTNFETPAFFVKKKAKIIGYIKGYNSALGAKTGIFYYTNELTNEGKPKVLEIHKDGRFELELPLEYPMQNYFVIENQVINFYLEPGQNLSVILNWEDLKAKRVEYPLKKVTYQGALKKINTDLVSFKLNLVHLRTMRKKLKEMEPLAFKEDMLRSKEHFLSKIKAYEQSGEIDKKTSELLENQIILKTYENIFDYFSFSKEIELRRKGINIKDKIPAGYYDFIKDIPFNKQSLLVNSEFSVFINRLEYAPPLKSKENHTITTSVGIITKDFLAFLESKNIETTLEDKKLIDATNEALHEKKTLSNELQAKIAGFYKKHESLVKVYITYTSNRRETQKKNSFIREWKERDSLAASLGMKNNLVYEIIKSRTLKFQLEQDYISKEDKAWYWSELKKGIKSPHLIKIGNDFFESQLLKPEFYKLPDSEPGTALFNKIIAPYKGKTVVVQFWDPWSYYQGEDLERMKKRRSKYDNNEDVVFLFITNESRSSIEKYNTSVEKNGFKNSIRIPQDDYNYMRQLFKFNNSVHDLIIKQDGETVYNDFQTHNMEYVFSSKFNIEPDN